MNCYACREDHYVSNCPYVEEAKKNKNMEQWEKVSGSKLVNTTMSESTKASVMMEPTWSDDAKHKKASYDG